MDCRRFTFLTHTITLNEVVFKLFSFVDLKLPPFCVGWFLSFGICSIVYTSSIIPSIWRTTRLLFSSETFSSDSVQILPLRLEEMYSCIKSKCFVSINCIKFCCFICNGKKIYKSVHLLLIHSVYYNVIRVKSLHLHRDLIKISKTRKRF